MKYRLAAALSLAPCLACAEPTVQDVSEMRESSRYIYVSGVISTWGWANVALEGKKLFCQPPKLVLTPEQTMSIVERFVEQDRILDSSSHFGLAALLAMQDVFPCVDDIIDQAMKDAAAAAGHPGSD